MRVRWTTSAGPDPRLVTTFPAVRPDKVATATIDGAPVYVTATNAHYDGDCPRPDTHDCDATAVHVWDAATGALVRTIDGAGGDHLVTTVVDGRPFAVTCAWSDTPKLIDLDPGSVPRPLSGHSDVVQGLATATLDGGPAVVSVGWDQTIRIFDLTTGTSRAWDTGARLRSVAMATIGGRTVALVAGDGVGIWDLELETIIGAVPVGWKVWKLATWPGDGSLVALLSFDGDVEVWDAATAARVAGPVAVRRHTTDLAGVIDGDGRPLLAVSDGEAVRLWDVDADRPEHPALVGPTAWCAVAGAGPGVLVTASPVDEAISVWRLAEVVDPIGRGHSGWITCLAVAPSGRVIAGGRNGAIGAWRLDDGEQPSVVGMVPAPVKAVAAVPVDGVEAVLAGGGDLNDVQDDRLHRWIGGHADEPVVVDHRGYVDIVVPAVVNGDTVVLTAGCDGTLRITDVATGAARGELPGDRMPDGGVAVAVLDGRPVAAVGRAFGPFTLWDLAARETVATPVTDTIEVLEQVHALVETPGGPAIVTTRHATVRLRLLDTGELWDIDPDNLDPVTAVAASGTAMLAVARTDGSVSVYDLAARARRDGLTLPYPVTALAWVPDGDLIVACRRDLMRVSL
jgi:WD40 repeat protein